MPCWPPAYRRAYQCWECLGCQLLAQALGGRVYRGDQSEIGPGTVALTADGRRDPVLGAATHQHEGDPSDSSELAVIHWHQDTFELPPATTHLAGSALYENQAFRVGENAYGLQFHVEVDRCLAEEWAPRLPKGVQIGKTTQTAVEQGGRRVIEAFFDLALARLRAD